LTKVNCIISHLLVIKKVVLLNISIQEDIKIQMKYKWLFLSVTALISDSIAMTQYHKNQWDQRWKNYRKCIANVNVISTQRLHLFNKMMKMHDDFQKAESTFVTYIRTECINLNTYLHSRNVSDINSLRCDCKWSHQMTKHVLMHCLNWLHLQSRMLQDADFLNYWIIIIITKSLRAVAKMMMKIKLLKQFKAIKTFIL